MSETAAFPGGGGTGVKVGRIAVTLAGVCSLASTLISIWSIWLQLKNYRKPLLQRYVVRILLMVPIYAISSWISLMSLRAAFFVEPIREIYEAFTIYTFFNLLTNFLGGERSLIIMMHGRPPKPHAPPFNYCLGKVDISDPHTFLAIKRGILQYAYLKPVLSVAAIIMKATGTYQEGYIGLRSGYFWSGLIYNVSVTVSLYSLAMFWVCMHGDLTPFRPVPKFLCIKLVIFASYWQGFFLSLLVWAKVIKDVGEYTPDNMAAAIQDCLICFELVGFAIAHWYAFSWKDYADPTISAGRMPVTYAFRDAFGPLDLIEDTKQTFRGEGYEYRLFDPGDNVLTHPESDARVARMMEGLRYERGGKGKYWIPKPSAHVTSRTPLLGGPSTPTYLPGDVSPGADDEADRGPAGRPYYTSSSSFGEMGTWDKEADEERLYDSARAMEFGDYNYPVITAYQPRRGSGDGSHYYPEIITTSTNQKLLRPKLKHKAVEQLAENSPAAQTIEHRRTERESSGASGRLAIVDRALAPLLKRGASADSNAISVASASSDSHPELVDLVVEDTKAEEIERVRARKEGGAAWNEGGELPRRFVKLYGNEEEVGQEIREGFDPTEAEEVEVPNITKRGVDAEMGRAGNVESRRSEDDEAGKEWADEDRHRMSPGSGGVNTLGHDEENVWQ